MNRDPDIFQEMQLFLDSKKIKFFTSKEVLFLGDSNKELKSNSFPERELWNNIIPTLRILDKAREEAGRIQLVSIYRNETYNRQIGGKNSSLHLQFNACDAKPLDCKPKELYKILLKLRTEGYFWGGLGLYPSFVHIDTRGKNSNW